jgi:hypothetical protein
LRVEANISNKQANISWVQFIFVIFFVTQAVFWLTSIYKDLQNDIDKTEALKLEIIDAREQSKRRIKNAEERILLKQEIEHLLLKNQFLSKTSK